VMRDGQEESGFAKYDDGDIVRVELNFLHKTVAFYKNGVLVCPPLLRIKDFEKNLYAAVTMYYPGDQITLV